jgi:predicted phosphodiesterase
MPVSTLIEEFDAEAFDRLLVFGGIYSNLQAVESVLELANSLKLAPRQIICTGDTAAYCGDPQPALETVRAAEVWHIKGNCEESLAESRGDCGCGFNEGTVCHALSASWFHYADSQVTSDLRQWMGGLPDALIVRFAGRRLAVLHGSPRAINQFVFRSTPPSEKTELLDLAGTDAIIAGHCGLPFTEILGSRMWHNSGALGMPANDGTPRTWFSLLNRTADGILIQHCALKYDYRSAAARMREARLPLSYATALVSGRWPNLDILPGVERLMTGVAIVPSQHLWVELLKYRPVQPDSCDLRQPV